jgi:hypothetical protein
LQVLAVAFSPDGKTLLTGGSDGVGRLWDAATHKPLGPPLVHSVDAVSAVAFGPKGRTAWTASWDVPVEKAGDPGQIRLWAERLTGMELDPDGSVRVLDVKSWRQRRQPGEPHNPEWTGARSPRPVKHRTEPKQMVGPFTAAR